MSERIDVILNDRVLLLPLTGVGHYVRQLLAALRELPDVEVRPFLTGTLRCPAPDARPRPTRPEPGRGEPGLAPPPLTRGAPFRAPWAWSQLAALRGRLRRSTMVRTGAQAGYALLFRVGARGRQLYHEPNHIPIRCGLPTVTTIHDLSVLVHPEWHPADRVRWYERGFAAGVRQTRRFIAASEFTKREMVARLGLPAERIEVTYQAPRAMFRPLAAHTAGAVCRALGLPGRFFVYVGTLEPRKNVAGLLAAYARLPAALRREHPLVLAGGRGWKMETLDREVAAHDLRSDVRLTGYLQDDALVALYTNATALVWPTWYEGFGLPPLEAMACGCPVITSAVTSVPEVVGDAGLLLPPADTTAWAEALRRMAEDDGWRAGWRASGLARAATFTWARCAEQTAACYRKALA